MPRLACSNRSSDNEVVRRMEFMEGRIGMGARAMKIGGKFLESVGVRIYSFLNTSFKFLSNKRRAHKAGLNI